MRSERIRFENRQGLKLSAILDLPVDRKPLACAIFAHCFTCSKNLMAVKHISRALTAKGLGVLRFDFTGLGQSEGAFTDSTFSNNISDLLAANDWLRREIGEEASILIGHSLGGTAVLHASLQMPNTRAVATIGSPFSPDHVQHMFRSEKAEIEQSGKARVELAGREFTITREFVEDLDENACTMAVQQLGKSLLVMHSPQDLTVSIDNAANIYTSARHPKSFVSLDGADHLLTNPADAAYAGDVIASWAKRYLELPKKSRLRTKRDAVASTGPESYTTDMLVSGHHLTADEPAEVGGNEFGPSPYGYLTAALASCSSMTMQMYARRKGWPLEEARVHVSHDKQHLEDCDDCTDGRIGKIDTFEKEIELFGELTEDQREKILAIASKCPVHKTLQNDVQIQTRLLGSEED